MIYYCIICDHNITDNMTEMVYQEASGMYAKFRSFVCAQIYVVVAVFITPTQKSMGGIGCKSGCNTMLVDGS